VSGRGAMQREQRGRLTDHIYKGNKRLGCDLSVKRLIGKRNPEMFFTAGEERILQGDVASSRLEGAGRSKRKLEGPGLGGGSPLRPLQFLLRVASTGSKSSRGDADSPKMEVGVDRG